MSADDLRHLPPDDVPELQLQMRRLRTHHLRAAPGQVRRLQSRALHRLPGRMCIVQQERLRRAHQENQRRRPDPVRVFRVPAGGFMSATRQPSAAGGLRKWLGLFVSFDKQMTPDPGTHKLFLGVLAVLLILPFFLSIPPKQPECICCAGVNLPSSCLSQKIFNVQCPGCGMTHSFVSITHGQLREAIRWNRMGIPLYLFFLFQAALRIRILTRPETVHSALAASVQHYFSWSVVALLLLNWFAALWLVLKGS
jgi:hypothetical protein